MSERDRIIESKQDHGTVRFVVTERGSQHSHFDCERRAKSSFHTMARWFARTLHTRTLWNDVDMRKADLRDLRWFLGDVAAYVEHCQRELDKIEGKDRTRERVKALRDVAGRTPEEAALYLAKATQLEESA